MRNTYKFTKMYSGGEPQFVEGDVFRITIPLSDAATITVGPDPYTITDGEINEEINEEINGEINEEINEEINLSETDKKVLAAIKKNSRIKRQELISSLEIGKSTLDRSLKKLKETGLLERVGSNKTGYWKCTRL